MGQFLSLAIGSLVFLAQASPVDDSRNEAAKGGAGREEATGLGTEPPPHSVLCMEKEKLLDPLIAFVQKEALVFHFA